MQLCYNQLTGSIPTQIGSLKRLNVLALQSNWLSGAIPASLGDLPELTRLDLSFNRLFGSIPVRLAQLPRLVILDVRNNSLSGSVPPGISSSFCLNSGWYYCKCMLPCLYLPVSLWKCLSNQLCMLCYIREISGQVWHVEELAYMFLR